MIEFRCAGLISHVNWCAEIEMSSAVANRRRRLLLSSDDDDEVDAGTRDGNETDDDTPACNQVGLLPSFVHDLHCRDCTVPLNSSSHCRTTTKEARTSDLHQAETTSAVANSHRPHLCSCCCLHDWTPGLDTCPHVHTKELDLPSS